MRKTVTQATRNTAEARMDRGVRGGARGRGAGPGGGGGAGPASREPVGGPASAASPDRAGGRAGAASRDPAGGRVTSASRDPAAARRTKPAATTGSARSAGRSPNESGIAAAPAGGASTWPAITPAPHSAAATANQRYARRDGPE